MTSYLHSNKKKQVKGKKKYEPPSYDDDDLNLLDFTDKCNRAKKTSSNNCCNTQTLLERERENENKNENQVEMQLFANLSIYRLLIPVVVRSNCLCVCVCESQ